MEGIDEILGRIPAKRLDQESAVQAPIRLDLVGTAEAAELLGIGRAAFSERRRRHENFPTPVAELRCGPVWFRWQIESYQAEEARLGRRGWYGRRLRRAYGHGF